MVNGLMRLGQWGLSLVFAVLDGVARFVLRLLDLSFSGRRRRFVFGSALILGGAWLLGAGFVAYALPQVTRLWEGGVWRTFERAADRADATILTDAAGRYLGVIDSQFDRDILTEPRRPLRLPGWYTAFPDHKAAHVDDAPPYYWRCLVALEDENRASLANPFGIDFLGVLRIPVSTVRRSIEARRLRPGAGGSTIEMQLARSFMKEYPGQSGGLASEIWRKIREWNAAPILQRRLRTGNDERRLRAWAARHIALIQGAGGRYDVFGVEAAGRALFGVSAEALSPAQQIALASAVYQPISYGAHRRWRTLLGADETASGARARRCANAIEVVPANERAEVNAELTELAETAPSPFVDDAMIALAEALGEPAERLARHPETLANRVARDIQQSVVAELRDQYGAQWRGQAAEVRLTIDVPQNIRFAERVSEAVLAVEEEADWRLYDRDLDSPAEARRAMVEDPARAPLVVAAADHRGRIVRFVDTSWDSLYGGPSARRDWTSFGRGAYDIALETREIASVGKIGAVLLMAEAGLTDPEEAWDNTCLRHVRPDRSSARCYGEGGSDERSTVTAQEAIAGSLNDAVIRRLSDEPDALPNSRLHRFMTDLGFALPGSHDETPARTNLVMGRYAGTPRHVHRLAALALEYARGNWDASVAMPTLIDSYVRIDPAMERIVDRRARDLDRDPVIVGDVAGRGNLTFVRRMLAAPACETRATLAAMSDWCPDDNPDVSLLVVKTGTRGLGNLVAINVYDWWVAGGVEFADGRRYSFVVAAGAGDPSRAFADDAGGGLLAPVVDALLRDLLENDEPE